jgi:uncharacterized protein (TIGR02598 family)
MHSKIYKIRNAFSLVEVVMAMGIISFSAFAIIGSIPTGLMVFKTTQMESSATSCMKSIADSVRGANCANGVDYIALGSYSNLKWSIGGANTEGTYKNIALGGYDVSSSDDTRLVYHVSITPPADAFSTGTANISVAWPSSAQWNDARTNWQGSSGSVSITTFFGARTP